MKKLILIGLLIVSTISCEDFEGWNIDDKHPGEVSGDYLVTFAQLQMARRVWDMNVNTSCFAMMAQYWTETTYTDEANYDFVTRNQGGNYWNAQYTNVLANLADAKRIIGENALLTEEQKANQTAIIMLMEAYTFQSLVDVYGYIPYSEAIQGASNLVPVYDKDSDVYNDLFTKITSAVNTLKGGGSSFGGADLIYGGDVAKWAKFGNSLKLRMAVRISDVDNAKATTMAAEAIASGIIMSHDESAIFPFQSTPPNTNPMWEDLIQSGRLDFVVSNTFVDVIAPLNDPRAGVFMQDNVVPYDGGPYGANNNYAAYTHIGSQFEDPANAGVMLGYDEAAFLKTEAIARGLISGDVEASYKEAITASIQYWTGSSSSAAAYLAQPSVKYDAANWKKSIGTQKWIAMFARGIEGWASWRMYDYPAMNTAAQSQLPVPRRYIYPNAESKINGTNYEAASSAMGGDVLTSRVFWDKGVGN